MDRISFSKAIVGCVLCAHSRHLTQGTIADSLGTFRKFQECLGSDDPLLTETTLDLCDPYFNLEDSPRRVFDQPATRGALAPG
jgi:hypothetical protein